MFFVLLVKTVYKTQRMSDLNNFKENNKESAAKPRKSKVFFPERSETRYECNLSANSAQRLLCRRLYSPYWQNFLPIINSFNARYASMDRCSLLCTSCSCYCSIHHLPNRTRILRKVPNRVGNCT